MTLTLLMRGGLADIWHLADQLGETTEHVGQAVEVLQAEGLVDVDLMAAPGQSIELTERGWGWCVAELAAEPPADLAELNDPGEVLFGRALYALLNSIHRFLEARDLSLAEFITTAQSGNDLRTCNQGARTQAG